MGTKVLSIAGFGPIACGFAESHAYFRGSLGIPFNEDDGGYFHTGALEGAKHFKGRRSGSDGSRGLAVRASITLNDGASIGSA